MWVLEPWIEWNLSSAKEYTQNTCWLKIDFFLVKIIQGSQEGLTFFWHRLQLKTKFLFRGTASVSFELVVSYFKKHVLILN